MTAPKIGKFDEARAAKFANEPAWEEVTWKTSRLRIPEGWLYRYEWLDRNTMVFVPAKLYSPGPG